MALMQHTLDSGRGGDNVAQLDMLQGATRPARSVRRQNLARLHAWEIWLLFALAIVMGLGGTWDVKWHYAVGRDSFWIPPHLLLYSSVALIGLLSLGAVLYETWVTRAMPDDVHTLNSPIPFQCLGFRGPFGLFLSGTGVVVMLLAAPFDDWWHRMFGIDVTIWSPPHLFGIVGGMIIGFGGLIAAAQERRVHNRRWADSAIIAFLMVLLGSAAFILVPALKLSFWPHGFSPAKEPFADNLLFYPLLASVLLTWPMAVAARLFKGRRSWAAPLAVWGAFVLVNVVQTVTARAGFVLFLPWGTQTLIRAPIVVERVLWDHVLLFLLPTLAFSAGIWLSHRADKQWGEVLSGGMIGVVLMIESITTFAARNPQDQIDPTLIVVGMVLAPLFASIATILGATIGRWLRGPTAS